MNREIKFRVWDKVEKIMYGLKALRHIHLYDDGSGFMGDGDHKLVTFDDYTCLQQYTGLTDKNGVDIYEGDILDGHSDGLVKVVFQDACWQCIFSDEGNIGLDEMCIWFGNRATVIGNVHQHPELLTP